MSLKAFHLLFIVVSILLALGFGGYEIYQYTKTGGTAELVLGVLSVAAGAGLIFYLRAFLRKLKDVNYL